MHPKRRDREARGGVGEVEADDARLAVDRREAVGPAPALVLAPRRAVGAPRVVGAGAGRVGRGALGERRERGDASGRREGAGRSGRQGAGRGRRGGLFLLRHAVLLVALGRGSEKGGRDRRRPSSGRLTSGNSSYRTLSRGRAGRGRASKRGGPRISVPVALG